MKFNPIIKYLYTILAAMVFICSCENSRRGPVVNLEVEFDGFKGDFYKKYDLWLDINDSLLISVIITV